MILVPLEYLKKHLFLPPLTLSEIAEKLTYLGLETQLIKKNGHFYLEVNPLPNRNDLFCWWGIVQEVKTLFNCSVKPPNLSPLKQSKKKLFSVSIATKSCLTFNLSLIKNIEIKPSPLWLKEWLAVNQILSVNNLVDSVNLVRLESGQNLRIYDYEVLKKKKWIVMEEAKKKENLQFFSEKELILNPEDLVVRADGEIISIAGITETEKINWTEPTKNILLEEVSFEPLRLKKTARRLKFPIPPTNFSFFPPILFRITSLLTESQENSLSSEVVFTYQKHFPKPRLIEVSQPFLEKKIGQKFPPHQIESIWKQLNFSYSKKEKVYLVMVPFWRIDIQIPEDLLEELLRIYDYNQIVSSKSL